MKKALKKILSSILVAVMILTAVPLSGFVGLKLNFDWLDFSTKSSALDASGKCGENVTYTFNETTGLLTISGTGDMTDYSWNDSPFYENSLIKNVVIEDGVTSIGGYAFFGCENLTSVTIPDSVTSIGEYAFGFCTGLTSVAIGNSVISIGEYAFYHCTGLTSLTIPDSVTSIGYDAFFECTGLTSITVDEKNQYYSSDEYGVLFNKDKTELIKYPIGNSRTTYTIPNSVKSIGVGTFSSCAGLTNVTIPNSVTSIGNNAFCDCTGLTSVTIPDSVTSIGDYAFYSCEGLTSITVDEKNQYYSNDEYGVLFNKDKTELIQYPIGNSRTTYEIPNSVTSIGEYAFYNCTGLTSITIPDSVKSIGESAFEICTSLTSVTIGNGVTSIGDGAFGQCTGLTSVTIPDSVTSIGDYAFYWCTGLTSITIPDSVTSIGNWAFDSCKSLTSLTIPDSVTSIGAYAFYNCTGLTSITVDEKNQYYSNDEYGVLFNKYKTELIQYPISNSRITYTIPNRVTSIGAYAFYNCNGLTNVAIPDSVTSIGWGAFEDCNGLTSVIILDSVTSIGDYAFGYCWSLKNVFYSGTEQEWNEIEIGENNDSLTDAYIHYGVSAEAAATHWTETVISEPDCVNSGRISVTCDCGYSYERYVSSLGHIKSSVVETVAPSCMKEGYTVYNCERCNCDFYDDYTEKLGHDFVDGKCTRCDATSSTTDIQLNEFKQVKTTANGDEFLFRFVPTESGEYYFFSDSKYDTYGYIYDSEMNELASDDDNGDNGNFLISYDFIAGETYYLKGRLYNEEQVGELYVTVADTFTSCHEREIVNTVEPTCTNYGYTEYHCSRCGAYYKADRVQPLGHDYVTSTIEANCVTDGGTLHKCSRCSASYVDEITQEATGHNYVDGVCANCGWDENLEYNIEDRFVKITDYTGDAKEIVIPDNLCGLPVTSIGSQAFEGCQNLTNVTIPNSVTSIGSYAFYNCTGLTNVTIPDSVTSIGSYAFYRCNRLTSITIPDSVTSIGYNAFYDCTGLTSVTIPDSVTYIGSSAFRGCTGITSITVNEKNQYYSSDEYGVLFNKDKTKLIQYPIGNSRTSYEIPNSVTSIGHRAFDSCKSLTSITVPDSVTSIDDNAFYGCSSLTNITIPDSVTSIGALAFYECTDFTSVTIPDSVTNIGEHAFCYCTGLTSVTISDSVTSIGYGAFEACKSLTSITIPDSVTSIGNWAFGNCTGLTSITIPDSVTSIGEGTFGNCTSLTSVIIPKSVTNIGYYAFGYCQSLKNVFYSGTEQEWNEIEVGEYNEYLTNAYIHCGVSAEAAATHCHIDITKAAKCKSEGYMNVSCDCGYSYEDTIPALGHDYVDGYCSRCGAKENCQHENTQIINKKKPTCNKAGYSGDVYCLDCKEVVEHGDYISCHYNTKRVIETVAPTCTSDGYTKYICTECDAIFYADYVSSLGHSKDTLIEKKEPTCTTMGYTKYHCNRCDCDFKTDYVGFGHSYVNNVCTKCGSKIMTVDISLGESKENDSKDRITYKFVPEESGTYYFYSLSMKDTYGYLCDSEMNELSYNDDGGYNNNFKIAYNFEAGETYYLQVYLNNSIDEGTFTVCLTKDFADVVAAPESGAIIDRENKYIYGLSQGLNQDSIENYILVSGSYGFNLKNGNDIGTGSKLSLFSTEDENDITQKDEYTFIVFGDVNGDGLYDGTDSVIVNCLANGMLTKEQVGDAAYSAADCNHDGVVDSLDVALLEQAGLSSSTITQTK